MWGLMSNASILTAPEIRQYYVQAIHEIGDGRGLNYIKFHAWLRARGMRPKGGDRKEEQRSIYNALTGRDDFIKVSPGVFALPEKATNET